MGNRQMNESDIMNSHTLMRHIYCRHQQWRGGPLWGGGGGVRKWANARHTLGYTDTWTHGRTHTATHMTWRCVCNCSVFNPAMCLLSRHIHITVPSPHTRAHALIHNGIVCLQKPAVSVMVLTSWPCVIAADWFIQGEQIAVFLPFNEWDPPLFYILSALPSSPPCIFVSKLTVWMDGWMMLGGRMKGISHIVHLMGIKKQKRTKEWLWEWDNEKRNKSLLIWWVYSPSLFLSLQSHSFT